MTSRRPRSFTLPTARMTTELTPKSWCLPGNREPLGVEPKTLDVVETPRLLLEDVHDDVAEIDEDPRRGGRPFDGKGSLLFLGARLFDRLGQRVDVTARPAGHENEKIGVVDLSDHVEDLDGERLLLERGTSDDERQLAGFLG